MFSRFSGTLDENEYQQSMFLISRGIINPYTTAWGRPFIRDHGSFFIWLLAPLDWIPPVGLLLLFAGVLCVVAAEIIAFQWLAEVAEKHVKKFGDASHGLQLAIFMLLIIVCTPWTWWVISFDVHGELFAAPFIIAAARSFSKKQYKRGWFWVFCTLGIGAIVSTWIVGLGLSALIAALIDRRSRRTLLLTGAGLGLTGLAFLQGLSALGLDSGSNLNTLYGYLTVPAGGQIPRHLAPSKLLKSMLLHPPRVVQGLLNHLQDLYANLAPTGFIGALTPWTFGVPVTILVENNLVGSFRFSGPIFQSTPIYTFTAVGLGLILLRFTMRWSKRAITGLFSILLANTIIWSCIFVPHLEQQWVAVSQSQASVLQGLLHTIPESSEVIISQGEIARFSMRKYIYGSTNQYHWPIKSNDVWFIDTPGIGVEFTKYHDVTVAQRLAACPYATFVEFVDGIYVFHLHMPSGATELTLPKRNGEISAAFAAGPAGIPVMVGPVSNWTTQSTGASGYVVAKDYWDEFQGNYRAQVRLSNAGPVNVEVWDTNGSVLLARQQLVAWPQMHWVRLQFALTAVNPTGTAYRGWGPFTVKWKPEGKAGQNQLEVRVWSPGSENVVVNSIVLKAHTAR